MPELPSKQSSYQWSTTFVVRHEAGSEEGAIHQRNQWSRWIDKNGGEVSMAATKPGDDTLSAFFAAVENDDDE